MIFLEGSPSAGLWIVENGRVKAYKLSPDGQEFILHFLGPGDTFNDIAALDGAPNPVSATAVTDVSAWVISSAVFSQALQADHEMALAVIKRADRPNSRRSRTYGRPGLAFRHGPPGPFLA
jgi:CRP/FNR family transcriptional regulator